MPMVVSSTLLPVYSGALCAFFHVISSTLLAVYSGALCAFFLLYSVYDIDA
jgi:hypothetical protein